MNHSQDWSRYESHRKPIWAQIKRTLVMRGWSPLRVIASVNDTNPTRRCSSSRSVASRSVTYLPPSIQPPHQYHIDFPATCSLHQFFPHLPPRHTRTDLSYLHRSGPSYAGWLLAHAPVLHWQRLVILRGNAGMQAGTNCFGAHLPLPKTFPDFLMPDPRFTGISRSSPLLASDYGLWNRRYAEVTGCSVTCFH